MSSDVVLGLPGDLVPAQGHDQLSPLTWRVGGRPVVPAGSLLELGNLTCTICGTHLSLVVQVA